MTNAALLGTFGDVGGGPLLFRNKVMNGDMSIFQRATAATTDGSVAVDRWKYQKSTGATSSLSQNADVPSGMGFLYSLRETVTTGDASIAATEYSGCLQGIEGYLIKDLNFGTSTAKPVTIQFWVRSSVIGQYTADISNTNDTRMCPFNFNINVANTWEFKTVTLPGCTDGTWNTSTGAGMWIRFFSAIGSNFLGGSDGVWNSTSKFGSGSPVNGIASNGNIFAITGVQLEAGLSPTPFEFLPIQTQTLLCQRYYLALVGRSSGTTVFGSGFNESATLGTCYFGQFPTPMRIEPTGSLGAGLQLYGTTAVNTTSNFTSVGINAQRSSTSHGALYLSFAGAYAGGSYIAFSTASGIQVAFSAEL